MAFKSYGLLLLAAVILISFTATESREIRSSDAQRYIADFVLRNQGTSLERIHDKLIAANGNVELSVREINSELKSDILRIDGDLIRFNRDNLKAVLENALRQAVRVKYAQNPFLASIVEKRLEQQLRAQSERIDAAIENYTISIDAARELLEKHRLQRSRRSLQPRAGFDLGSIVSDLVFGILQSQLSNILFDVIENVKNVVVNVQTPAPVASDLDNIFAFVINTGVKQVVQLLTLIQDNLRPTTPDVIPPVGPDGEALSRKRREATGLQAGADGAVGGLLDLILGPILDLLGLLLSPVNALVEGLINSLVGLLQPLLGSVLTGRISALVTAIFELLKPLRQV